MFSRLRLTLVLLCPGFVAGCDGSKTATAAAPKGVEEYFPVKVGGRMVRMQIAALPPEMQRGLMHRKSLGADAGMLFVFAQPQQLGFWMRETTLLLDIGYFDSAGVLKEIYPLYPLDERSVASRARDLQFALEMNQGWFKQSGVKPGARLDLKAVAEALRSRGLRPETAGLR